MKAYESIELPAAKDCLYDSTKTLALKAFPVVFALSSCLQGQFPPRSFALEVAEELAKMHHSVGGSDLASLYSSRLNGLFADIETFYIYTGIYQLFYVCSFAYLCNSILYIQKHQRHCLESSRNSEVSSMSRFCHLQRFRPLPRHEARLGNLVSQPNSIGPASRPNATNSAATKQTK